MQTFGNCAGVVENPPGGRDDAECMVLPGYDSAVIFVRCRLLLRCVGETHPPTQEGRCQQCWVDSHAASPEAPNEGIEVSDGQLYTQPSGAGAAQSSIRDEGWAGVIRAGLYCAGRS